MEPGKSNAPSTESANAPETPLLKNVSWFLKCTKILDFIPISIHSCYLRRAVWYRKKWGWSSSPTKRAWEQVLALTAPEFIRMEQAKKDLLMRSSIGQWSVSTNLRLF